MADAQEPALSGRPQAEPSLPDVQREFPHWRCSAGYFGLCHAKHQATGCQVSGEGPLDLRDRIKAAEARVRATTVQHRPPPAVRELPPGRA
jgi:hypothetical protein